MSIIHEECKRLTVSELKRQGALKQMMHATGIIGWKCNGEDAGRILYELDTIKSKLVLKYTIVSTNEAIQQHIDMVTIPSNLGAGVLYYFICPYTGNRVRTLYMAAGSKYFKSRKAYSMPILYRSQCHSRYDRWNERYWKLQHQIEQLTSKGYTHTYNGKLTATAKRVFHLREKQDYADFKRWMPDAMPHSIRKHFIS